MRRREQRPRRERAVEGEEDRLATSEIVEHRGDAVGPLLQGRQSVRRHGIGRSRCPAARRRSADRAMSSPRPTLEGTVAPEHALAAREPVRDEHQIARAFAAKCDRRRASSRSAHSASPRTLRKCKPTTGSSFGGRQTPPLRSGIKVVTHATPDTFAAIFEKPTTLDLRRVRQG